jgi:hypothetical protein
MGESQRRRGVSPLPASDRAMIIELLARMLVNDLRKYPTLPQDQSVASTTVVPRRGPEA